MTLTKIKLVSNNICYGPMPERWDEVVQILTIHKNGRVWFSAKNYEQYSADKGTSRKRQVSIGRWKAEFLLSLIQSVETVTYATDMGTYTLSMYFDDGSIRKIDGSLCGGIKGFSYGKKEVDLTKLLRRYIPIYGLWGFDSNLSPDYEGKKQIYKFAESWRKKMLSGKLTLNEFVEHLGDECIPLGFNMDRAEEFCRLYPRAFYIASNENNLKSVIREIKDIDLLGSAVISQWRNLTHWSEISRLTPEMCEWFAVVFGRMEELTRKKKEWYLLYKKLTAQEKIGFKNCISDICFHMNLIPQNELARTVRIKELCGNPHGTFADVLEGWIKDGCPEVSLSE